MPADRVAPSAPAALTSRPTPGERERVVQQLAVHFASDHLSMDELEERLARVYQAQSTAQLDALVRDLPALSADAERGASVLAPASEVPARGVMWAVLGGTGCRGSWVVPRRLKVVAILGGAEIDLRLARFAPGVTEIDVTAILGGVEIIVPPSVRVETLGTAFLGGFEASAGDVAGDAAALGGAQPLLRVSGLAMLGGVDVKVRRPGTRTPARVERAGAAARRATEPDQR
jgi:hypothetical protein